MSKRSHRAGPTGTMATVGKVRQSSAEPARVQVAADGSRVVFLRPVDQTTGPAPPGLWAYEVDTSTARLVLDPTQPLEGSRPDSVTGVDWYAMDLAARLATARLGDQWYQVDLDTGALARLTATGPISEARPDPTGQRIGYRIDGALHILEQSGEDLLLAGEPEVAAGGHPGVTWAVADSAATLFGRHRGWWWSPDGQSVLAARVDTSRPRPAVSLHLLELDGGWVDVHWDRETYPYLVGVSWSHRDPLIAVLRRPQQHGLVLAVDARTGETQVHAELADPRWVEPVTGTPCQLADGRVLVGGELAHDGYDARCLFADGTLLTPPWLYVRRVVGRLPDGDVLVEGTAGEPSEQHLFRVPTGMGTGGLDARPVTAAAGWHQGVLGGGTLVVGSRSLEYPGARWTVWRGDTPAGELVAGAFDTTPPEPSPRPVLQRITDRRLPSGVLYPRGHVAGRPLPVLLHVTGLGQGVRALCSDWQPRQHWADSGFAVVVIDHRGTPGVAPSFEKVVHRRLADLALADLVEGLTTLAGKHPDLDLTRVVARGTGVGGWLAAMAVLRQPDQFVAAIAEQPLLDWRDEEPTFAERYLGSPDDGSEVYQRHSVLEAARTPEQPVNGRLLVVGAPPELALPGVTVRAEASEEELLDWIRAALPTG